MKTSRITQLIAAAALTISASTSHANLISTDVALAASNLLGSVQQIGFSVTTSGQFSVEALGAPSLGSGYNSDPQLFLFSDDGSLDSGDLLGTNDDGGLGFESLLSIFLNTGSYIASVSEFSFNVNQAVSGIEDTIGNPGTLIRLQISSKEGSAAFDVARVPAPATLALFGLGLAGLGYSRRKKA